MKKKWKIVFLGIFLLVVIILIGFNSSPEKKIAGEWQLKAICEDYSLNYSDFGEYEYFNMRLSSDGVINIFAYPNEYSGVGSYVFIEKKDNGIYEYAVNIIITNSDEELKKFGAILEYSAKKDELRLFVSEGDGFFLERTDEMTTVEITTTESNLNNYISEYDYKLSCASNISSRDLVRYEDEYVGENFSYTGRVFNIYEDDNVYLIQTDENGDGLYGDNQMYVQDCRKIDKTKILEGDIITIYGKFTGVATNNYPCLKFYYADIKNIY